MSGMGRDESQETSMAAWSIGLFPGEWLFLLLLAVFWIGHVYPIAVTEGRHGGDVFRDVACARNMMAGRFLSDPAYAGELLWYPPLSPAIVAVACSVSGADPMDCYRWSQLVFNWLLPVGMFVVVRATWGPRVGVIATVAMLLAMPWWQHCVAQGQPSVHAVAWGWLVLLLFGLQEKRRSWRWALVCGGVLGVSFWHHPLIPGILLLSFVLEAVVASVFPGGRRDVCGKGLWQRRLVIVLSSLILAVPVLYLMLHGTVVNRTPREFVAPELCEFSVLKTGGWILATGFLGVVLAIRRRDCGSRVLLCATAVCAIGTSLGFLRMKGPAWAQQLPVVVPHEFQWSLQLAWAVCMGIGISWVINKVVCRWLRPRMREIAGACLLLAAICVTGWGGMTSAGSSLRRFEHCYADNFPDARDWVLSNTEIDDVFACHSPLAFVWLNAETGRKVWITEPGHSNPRVDHRFRALVMQQMAGAESAECLWRIARERGIDYLIPTADWFPAVFRDPIECDRAIPRYFRFAFRSEESPAILEVVADTTTPK